MRWLLTITSISTIAIALLVSAIEPIEIGIMFPIVIASILLMIVAFSVWSFRLWRIGRIDVRDQNLISPTYEPMLRVIGILRVSFGLAGLLLLIVGLIVLVVGVGGAVVFSAFLYVTAAMYFNLSVGSVLANIAIMRSASGGPRAAH
jgi:hypothetical protein